MPEVAAQPGFLLAGRWVAEGRRVEVRSPYDGSVVGTAVEEMTEPRLLVVNLR